MGLGGLSTNSGTPPRRAVARRRRLSALPFLLLAALLLVPTVACGGGRRPVASPTAAPTPSPPAADVPLDLDLADKLLHDGDVERALAIYNAVAKSSQGEGAEWRRAVQSAARVHYRQGRSDAVAGALTAPLDEDPP